MDSRFHGNDKTQAMSFQRGTLKKFHQAFLKLDFSKLESWNPFLIKFMPNYILNTKKTTHFILMLSLTAICLLWYPLSVNGKGGVYESTKHGTGIVRIPGEPRGDCIHCHDEHASKDGIATPGGPYDYLLFTRNDNSLCYTCHNLGGNNSYQDSTTYNNSSHATGSNVYWPGPDPQARLSSDSGKCVNCHTPHGYNDSSGLIPNLTFSREENLCQNCHDGSPASNIKSEMTKAYRHPAGDLSGRHNPTEGNTPNSYGNTNRHAECSDCHNAHVARSDTSVFPPNASNRIKGVSGVDIINGSAGTKPSYSYISASAGVSYEYQLCFKCHSSWTTQPAGQSDMATLFNPSNPSYHPVEAMGRNANINPASFVNGWTSSSKMYCGDCHSSNNASVEGPHGSQYNHILKKDYYASSTIPHTTTSNEICFDCHNYDTYANKDGGDAKNYSRFKEHIKHVIDKKIGCYNCHGSHGSTDKPYLIVIGRTPGVAQYTETANGGSCSGSSSNQCHNSKNYTVTYPR